MRSRSFALLSLVKQNLMWIDTPAILINKFGAITADNVVEWASRTMRWLLIAACRHTSQVPSRSLRATLVVSIHSTLHPAPLVALMTWANPMRATLATSSATCNRLLHLPFAPISWIAWRGFDHMGSVWSCWELGLWVTRWWLDYERIVVYVDIRGSVDIQNGSLTSMTALIVICSDAISGHYVCDISTSSSWHDLTVLSLFNLHIAH